jgi:hypothetical protein
MKVRELMNLLKDLNPEHEVVMKNDNELTDEQELLVIHAVTTVPNGYYKFDDSFTEHVELSSEPDEHE